MSRYDDSIVCCINLFFKGHVYGPLVTSSLVESEFEHAHYIVPRNVTFAQVASIVGIDRMPVSRCDVQTVRIHENVDMSKRINEIPFQGESNMILFHLDDAKVDQGLFWQLELFHSVESLARLVNKYRMVQSSHVTASMGQVIMEASTRYNQAARHCAK